MNCVILFYYEYIYKISKAENLFYDYCQFLIACFTNWTQTYFANHTKKWRHDQLNRFLRNEDISSSELYESVKDDIEYDDGGYIVFDDVVLPKPYAKKIEVLRSQWSGSDKKVVVGIGIVTCLYVNPKTHEYWIIDYRLFDKDHDGKTKIDHLLDMLQNAIFKKQLPFRTVLMDSWYASMKVMKAIERLSKIYYMPLKSNRLVNDTNVHTTAPTSKRFILESNRNPSRETGTHQKVSKRLSSEVVPDSVL